MSLYLPLWRIKQYKTMGEEKSAATHTHCYLTTIGLRGLFISACYLRI